MGITMIITGLIIVAMAAVLPLAIGVLSIRSPRCPHCGNLVMRHRTMEKTFTCRHHGDFIATRCYQ